MRYALIAAPITALVLLCSVATPATAQVSISIGINLPVYPTLQRVPGYPVYYAPQLNSNYFFYDGLYWVYEGDNWYTSPWYNGPWEGVDRFDVPVYLLRVPVRYYRSAPVYFRGWRADAPPRWGDHWGSSWEQRRSGWDRWNRNSAPPPAPLPLYQRQYSGSKYPQRSQQVVIQTQNYRYQPREAVVQQRFQQYRAAAPAAAPAAPSREAQRRAPTQQQQEQQLQRKEVQQQRQQEQKAQLQQRQQLQKQRQQQQSAQQEKRQQQRLEQRAQQQSAQQQPAPKAAPAQRAPAARDQAAAQPQPQGKAKGRDKDDKDDRGPGRDKDDRGKGRDK